MKQITFEVPQSSLVKKIEYCPITGLATISFAVNLSPHQCILSEDEMLEFLQADSIGKHYLTKIKNKKMADKIIKCKIDVTKVNKDWLFQGEKGVYLNFTLLFNSEEDRFGNNGMLVQDVPTEVYKKDKAVKGGILGNVKEFGKESSNKESAPGVEAGKLRPTADISDDLPF